MTAVVVVALGVAVLAAVVAATVAVRTRRALERVLDGIEPASGRGLPLADGPVERLVRVTGALRAEVGDAQRQARRLVAALDALGDGVVVADRLGQVVAGHEVGPDRDRHAAAVARDALDELLAAAVRGETGERELPLFGPPKRVLHLWARPLHVDGDLLGAVAFVRDVSEARRIESVRRDFVTNVSHELKTPVGALALLAETMAGEPDPVVTSQLAGRVLHEAERLARIVDDLLDLSLVEAQEAPSRDPVPVHLLLGEAYELMRGAAEAAGVPIDVRPVSTDLELVCDRRQVVSAIRNLLDNAVKYSESGDAVELGARTEGDRVTISVRDHGMGIPRRDLERIFERFYRVDKARSRETGGTGLGLSIVRHVVQAHGGDVTVDSVEGEGSVFRLRLPRRPGAERRMSEVS